jgi:D-alanyl-D-alanine-carboxypeptidase/D-alanyl-D-alanine-endopeptidase
MKRLLYIFSISMVLISSTLHAQQIPVSKIESQLNKLIENLISETGIPSVSIALFNSDSVNLSRAYGFSNMALKAKATPQTIYHTGSTFKTVTATAIVQLCESGKIDLDVPVNQYLKSASIENTLNCDCPITMRHLLSHQSGLSGKTEMKGLWDRTELKDIETIAKEVIQVKEPGKDFEYCNHCYAILALVLEHVTGVDYVDYITDNILAPLKISENPFAPNPEMMEVMAMPYKLQDNKAIADNFVRFDIYPAGDAYLNPTLFAKLLIPQINKGKYKEISLLDEESINEMQSEQIQNKDYGLGLFRDTLDSHKTISHGGTLPGFTAYYLIDLETKNGVCIMSNAGEIRSILEALSKYAIQLMNGNKTIEAFPGFKKEVSIEISDVILQTYIGKYEVAPGFIADITQKGNKLFVQITGQPRFDLLPYEETKFELKVMDAQIEFIKNYSGKVNDLILYQGKNKVLGIRVD